jgi:hypothetical protein
MVHKETRHSIQATRNKQQISNPLTNNYQDEEKTQDTMGLIATSSGKIFLQQSNV